MHSHIFILFCLTSLISLVSICSGQPQYPPITGNTQQNTLFQTQNNPFFTGEDAWTGQREVSEYGSEFAKRGETAFVHEQSTDWHQIDRRAEEGWWHLYPYGELYDDVDILGRPFNDQQIDLDFFFPYFGFRFNYTFIFPEGFIAFSYPWYIQPPYSYPNPKWPDQPDPTLIAAFMIDQTPMAIGEEIISHVWYRVIERPAKLIGYTGPGLQNANAALGSFGGLRQSLSGPMTPARTYQGTALKSESGRVQDPQFLDRLTLDIRESMVGTRGFVADYALLVTWERMAYGGAPKEIDLSKYNETRKKQNTYQMIIATDEIRSYTIFNFANIFWTSSTSSGAFSGRGGRQSAMVGFNGGNGTGFVQLPYSSIGNSFKLEQFGSTPIAGRWLARVDEQVVYGGCTNDSTGVLHRSIPYANMLGGFSLNVSGPCFRKNNVIKLQLDELTVDCTRINMAIAQCVIPVYRIFRIGPVDIKLSVDGGKNYPFWNIFTILAPQVSRNRVNLINDPLRVNDNWMSFEAQNLTLSWQAVNITNIPGKTIDISLWGYWEDVIGHRFEEVGSIASNIPNTGVYSFNPRQLSQSNRMKDAWKTFVGGVVQVKATDDYQLDTGDRLYWSRMIPFGWYFQEDWKREYGEDWALDICLKWYDWDGRRDNFQRELEPSNSCPCTLNQALADYGRFVPEENCNMFGDSLCFYTYGAKHCILSSRASSTGAGQQCCYDYEGWLMFTDDYEYNDQYLRFYSAGRPYRAHPWGSFPYQRPPFVPSLSSYQNDLLPYDMCCRWAGHCEFYFWRRMSSGCQEYQPTKLGFAYGDPHFVTYDNVKYTFNGKGYYILTMMRSPRHNLMVQVRMEQPVKTQWYSDVPATIITGIAAVSNGSSVVQIFARKNFMRWRYKMDLYVDNRRYFTDKVFKKTHIFRGVKIYNPARNMNMSEIDILFDTGVGIKVMESNGMLSIAVSMPPDYNETIADTYKYGDDFDQRSIVETYQGREKCASHYRTLGLLGVYNDDPEDDLTSPDCDTTIKIHPGESLGSAARSLYEQFGEKWRVDGIKIPLLFSSKFKPLYNPLEFADNTFVPLFDIFGQREKKTLFYESLLFSYEQVKVFCQNVPTCIYDYIVTGRKEIGGDTLNIEKKLQKLKQTGETKLISCGPLSKNIGVVKYPIGNNYLDGVQVTFTCRPEYFLHGTPERTCNNGTWSPGWWVWCRTRTEENALKWATGIIVSLLFILVLALIFLYCYCMRVKGALHNQQQRKRRQQRPQLISSIPSSPSPIAVFDHEPGINEYQKHVFSEPPLYMNGHETEPHRLGVQPVHSNNGKYFTETSA